MDGGKLVDEMNTFLEKDVSTSVDAAASEDDALPFETIDDYSTDPLSFSDMSLSMLKRVETLFDLAVKYNRRSSQFLKYCGQLEKGIRYLGSCCLTKNALETKNNVSFPELGQLSTGKLYRMTSFHYRKIERALNEYLAEKGETNDSLLDMQFRYFNLLQRLRSTETKIYNHDFNFTFGKKDYDPIVNGLAFSEKSWSKGVHWREKPAVFRQAASLPMLAEPGLEMKTVSGLCEPESGNEDPETVANVLPETAEEPQSHSENEKSDSREEESLDNILPALTADSCQPEDDDSDLPESMKILNRVVERSQKNGDGALDITPEELKFLAEDPVFAEIDPELAADFRSILMEADSS